MREEMRSGPGRGSVLDGIKTGIVESEERRMKQCTERMGIKAQFRGGPLKKDRDRHESRMRTGCALFAKLEGLGFSRAMS